MSNDVWAKKHIQQYVGTEWIDKPSLFAQEVISYFPDSGQLLELGAGQGQDSQFFAQQGYLVTSTDFDPKALDLAKQKLPPTSAHTTQFELVDLRQSLPYQAESFDIIYAHLSLHYFDAQTTKRVFGDIYKTLRPGGVFACLVNSTSDPQYKTVPEIEPDYFFVDDMGKRYFSPETLKEYVNGFEIELLDNKGDTYKDIAKGVHNLVRFVGRKVV